MTQSVQEAKPLLSVTDVTVRFGGILALDGVSMHVHAHEICALIGPNGAGKSTLFNCLSRLYQPQSGRIEFNGQPIDHLPRHQMAALGVGRTFQNLALFNSMTVLENVLIGCHSPHQAGFVRSLLRWRTAALESQALHQAQELIEHLELAPVAHRVVSDLPFGTQKRVELARALACKPQLLLLDEPACGLNHQELSGLGQLIVDIRDRLHTTVLLVEHHMGLVMSISDRVVALNFGRQIAQGTPDVVRQHPEVIKAYLGHTSEVAA
jgi:branched-chain amino acid transport system ATP-binding protein